MPELSRRTVLRTAGAGAGVVAVGASPWGSGVAAALPHDRRGPVRTGDNPVVRENRAVGSDQWSVGCAETRGVDTRRPQMRGYASRASVSPGERLVFRTESQGGRPHTVAVYRTGHYGGVGARHLLTGEPVHGATWTGTVPVGWVSGVFLAVLTSTDGYRAYTPFVVREPQRRSDVLHVLPYRAAPGRPYAGLGLPDTFGTDASTARWLEGAGYDVTYATEQDLHEGTVDPAAYKAVLVSGQGDAGWSAKTRTAVLRAADAGTHLAFLASDGTAVRRHGRWRQLATGGRLHADARGTLLFASGTPGWALGLNEPEHRGTSVRGEAADFMARMLEPRT